MHELDAWDLDVGDDGDLDALAKVVESAFERLTQGPGVAASLFWIRKQVGAVFGWDPGPTPKLRFHGVPGQPKLRRWTISNKTVDARVDLRWGRLTVFAEPRGRLGRVYMAAINPFRHLVIYPTLVRAIEQAWRER